VDYTERQKANADIFCFKKIFFESQELSPLEAVVLADRLEAQALKSNSEYDHKRYAEIYNLMWKEHKAAVRRTVNRIKKRKE